MLTTTERVGRTRVRVSPSPGAGRCRVRTAITQSDATASVVRPVVVAHGPTSARVSLVPTGALLLADDVIEIDVTVDPGLSVELIEPGGTVAFDMRGAAARWDVRVDVGAGATLRWAGLPFVVSSGADVQRCLRVRCVTGGRFALRETLVLGRYGESPGSLRQLTTVLDEHQEPILVEDLALTATSAPMLLGGHRVLSSVLAVGVDVPPSTDDEDRFDLDRPGAALWRRLGHQAHATELERVWRRVAGDGAGTAD